MSYKRFRAPEPRRGTGRSSVSQALDTTPLNTDKPQGKNWGNNVPARAEPSGGGQEGMCEPHPILKTFLIF